MHYHDKTFNFLKEDFPNIEKICRIVGQNIYTNPVAHHGRHSVFTKNPPGLADVDLTAHINIIKT